MASITNLNQSVQVWDLIQAVHTTGFHGHALVEDLTLLLDLLSETLRQPVFPDDEVEKLRHQLLTGLAIRAQDTSDMADLTFDEILFHGHPYARPEDGFPETIQAITRQDLAEYHRKSFGPRGMVIADGRRGRAEEGHGCHWAGAWRLEESKSSGSAGRCRS